MREHAGESTRAKAEASGRGVLQRQDRERKRRQGNGKKHSKRGKRGGQRSALVHSDRARLMSPRAALQEGRIGEEDSEKGVQHTASNVAIDGRAGRKAGKKRMGKGERSEC